MIVLVEGKDHQANGCVCSGYGLCAGRIAGAAGGFEVEQVEREADGSWTVHVVTAAGRGGVLPGLREARRAGCKEIVGHTVRAPGGGADAGDLAQERGSDLRQRRLRAGRFRRGRAAGGARRAGVGPPGSPDDGPPGRGLAGARSAGSPARLGVGWHTAHDGFVRCRRRGRDRGRPTRRGRPATRMPLTTASGRAGADDAVPGGGAEDDPGREAAGPRPRVRCPGRCRRWTCSGSTTTGVAGRATTATRSPAGGSRTPTAGRRCSSTPPAATVCSVRSRAAPRPATAAGSASQPAAWRDAIRAVTIDMSTVYKSAARAALPHAIAGRRPVPRRASSRTRWSVTCAAGSPTSATAAAAGPTDPEYTIKGLLVRNDEKLSDAARGRLLCTLADLGDAGFPLGTAWRAKELLRDVLEALPDPHRPRDHPHRHRQGPDQVLRVLRHRRRTPSPRSSPSPRRSRHGASRSPTPYSTACRNAAAEGVNRLTKLDLPDRVRPQQRHQPAAPRPLRRLPLDPPRLATTRHRPPGGGVINRLHIPANCVEPDVWPSHAHQYLPDALGRREVQAAALVQTQESIPRQLRANAPNLFAHWQWTTNFLPTGW